MSDAVVKLGWDNSGARAGADEALRIAQGLKMKTDKALARVGSPGGMQKGGMGMLAMQVQDVAVQAQMGVSGMQIFAQQGSQMLSVFGTAGAVMGGVAAVIGTVASSVIKVSANFSAAEQTVNGLAGAMKRAGTSVEEVTKVLGQLGEARAEIEKLNAAPDAITAYGEIITRSTGIMESFTERGERLSSIVATANAVQRQGEAQLLAARQKEIEDLRAINNLRAMGKQKAADEMEFRMKTEQSIAAIKAKGFYAPTTEKLVELEERRLAVIKSAEDARKRQTARQGLNEARAAVEQFDETDEQRLNRLIREREGLQAAVVSARGDEVAQMEAARALAQQELAILETKRKIAADTAAEMKKQADAAMAAFNAESAAQAAARDRNAIEGKRGSVARADAEKELQILRLKAEGRMQAAAAEEKELQIRQRARQIAEEQNVSYKTALDLARQKMALEDQIAKKQEASTGRVKGYSRAEQGGAAEASQRAAQRMLEARQRVEKSRESFGGLREFYDNQRRDGNGRRVLPVGRAFEGASRGNDAAVGVLAEIKTVMESVNQYVGQLAAV